MDGLNGMYGLSESVGDVDFKSKSSSFDIVL
jgi:hypothetical protein